MTGSPLGKLDIEDPGHDDFELWSPSEECSECCLSGRQVSNIRHHSETRVLTFFVDFVPSGLATRALASYVAQLVGVDISPRMVEVYNKCVNMQGLSVQACQATHHCMVSSVPAGFGDYL